MTRDEHRTRLALFQRRVELLRQLAAIRYERESLDAVEASVRGELEASAARLAHAPEHEGVAV